MRGTVNLKFSIGLNIALLIIVGFLAVQNFSLRLDQALVEHYARENRVFGAGWNAPNLALITPRPYKAPTAPPGLGVEWFPPNLSLPPLRAFDPGKLPRLDVRIFPSETRGGRPGR